MTSTPPSVWPAPERQPESETPAARRSINAPLAGALVGVALLGVVVGVGADRLLLQSPGVNGVLPAIARAMQSPTPAASSPAAAAPAQQPAQPAQPQQPAATQPAQPAQPGQNAQPQQPGQPGAQRPGARQPGAQQPSAPAAPAAPSTGQQPGTGQQPSAPSTGQQPSGPAQQAIQDTIQRSNDAQEQAVASKDLSSLTATASGAFATQLRSSTQELIDSNVTSINLENVEWGPIVVSGDRATATSVETWSTTYADGSTEQSRDRNVYTLTQRNGSWSIDSNTHPDALPRIPDFLNPSRPGQPVPQPALPERPGAFS